MVEEFEEEVIHRGTIGMLSPLLITIAREEGLYVHRSSGRPDWTYGDWDFASYIVSQPTAARDSYGQPVYKDLGTIQLQGLPNEKTLITFVKTVRGKLPSEDDQARFVAFCDKFNARVTQLTESGMMPRKGILTEIKSLVNSAICEGYPDTQWALKQAYEDLASGETPETWANIARTCRQALISFANYVFKPSYVPEEATPPKGDDVKNRLKYILRRKLRIKRYREARENIIRGRWDFINSVIHRKNATRDDAENCIIYTYLTIAEVRRILEQDG